MLRGCSGMRQRRKPLFDLEMVLADPFKELFNLPVTFDILLGINGRQLAFKSFHLFVNQLVNRG